MTAEEAEVDRSAEEVLEELADPSEFFGGLYPENEKLQNCTSLNFTMTLCTQA